MKVAKTGYVWKGEKSETVGGVTGLMPESMPKAMPEAMPEAMPDPTPGAPKSAFDSFLDKVAEYVEPATQQLPDRQDLTDLAQGLASFITREGVPESPEFGKGRLRARRGSSIDGRRLGSLLTDSPSVHELEEASPMMRIKRDVEELVMGVDGAAIATRQMENPSSISFPLLATSTHLPVPISQTVRDLLLLLDRLEGDIRKFDLGTHDSVQDEDPPETRLGKLLFDLNKQRPVWKEPGLASAKGAPSAKQSRLLSTLEAQIGKLSRNREIDVLASDRQEQRLLSRLQRIAAEIDLERNPDCLPSSRASSRASSRPSSRASSRPTSPKTDSSLPRFGDEGNGIQEVPERSETPEIIDLGPALSPPSTASPTSVRSPVSTVVPADLLSKPSLRSSSPHTPRGSSPRTVPRRQYCDHCSRVISHRDLPDMFSEEETARWKVCGKCMRQQFRSVFQEQPPTEQLFIGQSEGEYLFELSTRAPLPLKWKSDDNEDEQEDELEFISAMHLIMFQLADDATRPRLLKAASETDLQFVMDKGLLRLKENWRDQRLAVVRSVCQLLLHQHPMLSKLVLSLFDQPTPPTLCFSNYPPDSLDDIFLAPELAQIWTELSDLIKVSFTR